MRQRPPYLRRLLKVSVAVMALTAASILIPSAPASAQTPPGQSPGHDLQTGPNSSGSLLDPSTWLNTVTNAASNVAALLPGGSSAPPPDPAASNPGAGPSQNGGLTAPAGVAPPGANATPGATSAFNPANIIKLSSWLMWMALMACVVGIFVSCTLWALGSKGQNPGQELTGKKGLILCCTAAFFVGALPGMLNWLDTKAHEADTTGVTGANSPGGAAAGAGPDPNAAAQANAIGNALGTVMNGFGNASAAGGAAANIAARQTAP